MSEAGNPQEPSMEEILASIRKIISEDSDEEAPAPARATQPASPPPAEEEPLELTEEVTEPEPEQAEEPLELTQEIAPAPGEDEIEALDEPEEEEMETPMPAAGEELISQHTKASAISSFRQLARNVKAQRPGLTVEQLAEELMRPMLREWLDENLPGMVERLVRREIERLARNSEEES